MINYLIQSTVCLAAFYLIYLLLKNERAFKFIRYYLLGAIVFSLVIPLVKIPVFSDVPIGLEHYDLTFTDVSADFENQLVTKESAQSEVNGFMSMSLIFWAVYLTGALLMAVRFFRNLYQIGKLKRSGTQTVDQGCKLIILNSTIHPFSFFKNIFLSETDYSKYPDDLILHEKAHAEEMHTVDILFVELLSVVFWFQPLIYLYRNAITLNHEFLADDFVLRYTRSSQNYLHKILEVTNHQPQVHLASNFSFHSLKNRIKMMSKKHPTKRRLALKSGLVAVVAISLFTVFAFTTKPGAGAPAKEFTVILDAGHGGKDPGASSEYSNPEKEITLSIARKVANCFADQKDINVILTRGDDSFISLKDRVAQTKKADLFLSIHAEFYQEEDVDHALAIYYDRNEFSSRAERFAKLSAYEFEAEGRRCRVGKADYFVLENALCPSVLLSVGFLSNEDGAKYINSESGQSKIADQISNAIRMAAL